MIEFIEKAECQYIVSKERKMVICIIDKAARSFLEYCYLKLGKVDMFLPGGKDVDLLTMPTTFIGVATLAEGDTWDEELGKDIAFAKAAQKFYRSFFKHAQTYVNLLDERFDAVVEQINKFGEKISRDENRRQQWIAERLSALSND